MSNSPNLNIPMPDPAADVDDEFYRLQQAWLLIDTILFELLASVAGKSNLGHTHSIAQVIGLVTALANKMDANKTFKLIDLVDVLGASNAATGYLLQKTVNGFGFTSAAAALGNHQHGTADIVGLVELIQQNIAALVNSSPAALDTLSELATAIGNDPNFSTTILNALAARYTKVEVNNLLAGIDAWAMQPVGSFVFFDDNTSGLTLPPLDKAYRYIDLTAGLSGSGGYNQGVLTTEAVSGSAPNVVATAVVSLAGSPFNTKTIRLLNTERRFLRPGSAGTLEESQNLAHTHTGAAASAGAHTHTIQAQPANSTSNNNVAQGDGGGGAARTTSSAGAHTHTLTIDSDGGTEARPRNVGVRIFRRIK